VAGTINENHNLGVGLEGPQGGKVGGRRGRGKEDFLGEDSNAGKRDRRARKKKRLRSA